MRLNAAPTWPPRARIGVRHPVRQRHLSGVQRRAVTAAAVEATRLNGRSDHRTQNAPAGRPPPGGTEHHRSTRIQRSRVVHVVQRSR